MNWPAFWRGFWRGITLAPAGFIDLLCAVTHGGGKIKRDSMGRINWQCNKCGRWSPYPVPLEDEHDVINRRLPVAGKEKA